MTLAEMDELWDEAKRRLQSSQPDATPHIGDRYSMTKNQEPYEEGKRAGAHPLLVVFGILIGLWLFVALIVPSSRNKQATGTEGPNVSVIEDPEAAPVMFKVQTTILDMNTLGLVVPSQATDSQIVALLKRLKQASPGRHTR